ncbi:unnamed protein product [Miscanthus lutarioriparius]|uniref:Separase-like TPR repeats region domain-containing protein n=1 Tax=Miscanthus lutarioriparius TaxID=422564 RepID=A0A811SL61_9POAL|nr:unnamed protein product [Miscanthus lutarioriparius]
MQATAADLLAALSSPSPSSHVGLYSRYAAYLQPFTAHLPTSRGSPTPCCLESLGRLARAGAEAAAALDALRSALSPPTTTRTRSRRRAGPASVGSVILPDPGVVGEAGTDPDVAVLGVELTVCLANCASKGKVRQPATYERVLVLVEQLQPWLRILAEHVTLLVNAMARCSYFLVAESSSFSADLVHRFCASTLEQCVNAQMIQHLLAAARKICSCVDLSWGGSARLLLDLLKCTTDSVMCLKIRDNEYLFSDELS